MVAPPVTGQPVVSKVMLVGQAPGKREREVGRPFAWTAGNTMFSWFERIGLEEEQFRRRVYMAAVCRCFPGKKPSGGDRPPSPDEVLRCSHWLLRELQLLQPELIIPVGKLAITQFMACDRLDAVVGRIWPAASGKPVSVAPLPHPSGASPWHRTEPGKSLLAEGLAAIARHPAWRRLLDRPANS